MNLFRYALITAAFAAAPLANAHADAFDGVDVATDADLADARGGFVSAGGITFDLGAIIRTYQNGQLALESLLTWTPQGALVTHTAGTPYDGAVQAAQAAAARLGGGGFTVSDGSGTTEIMHDISGQNLRSLVVTSASDTSFVQDIEVTITLPGFEAMQAGIDTDRVGLRLGSEISALVNDALHN